MLRITNGRDLFYQWDIGQSLTLTLAEGETVTSVHIGNDDKNPDGFYVVEPISGIVAVYDELLQSGQRVVAYEYVKSGNDGHTVRKYVFNVAKRPKADNYSYTPTTSYSWEYWCERARLYAVAAEGSKNSAAASVSSIPATMTAWWNAHRSEFKGDAGADGQDGADGTSASAVVEQTSNGAIIYCTDADGTTTATITNGQDGETPDLTDYVKNTDYATSSKGGVIKVGFGYGTSVGGGYLASPTKTYTQYSTSGNESFISKGTLENVLANKTVMVTGNQTLTDTEKANARKRIGLGDFELIETITLSENVATFTRNVEPSGTAYNFKRIRIILQTPITYPRQLYMCINGNTVIDSNVARLTSWCNSTYVGYSFIDCDVSNGLVNSETATMYGSRANAGAVTKTPAGWGDGTDNVGASVGFVSSISSIYLASYNDFLPKDLVIKIYGIR